MGKPKKKRRIESPPPREQPTWGRATSIASNAFTRFLDHHNLKAAAVAPLLGISRAAVYDLRRRQYLPKLELATRIASFAEQLGGPAVPPTSWSLTPLPEDVALSSESYELAMRSRSSRRQGPHGTAEERRQLGERRMAAEALPPASVLLALPEGFDD